MNIASYVVAVALVCGTALSAQVRAPAPAAPAPPAGSLQGRVTDARNGTAIADAAVVLVPSFASGDQHTTTTDSSGRFLFTDVEPGQYRLRATRQPYIAAMYGARRPGALGTQIAVGASQRVRLDDLPLMPQSVIAGQVIDEKAQPVSGVAIQLLARQFFQGAWRLLPVPVAQVVTNDRGEYRVAGLPAGRYHLVAAPSNVTTPQRGVVRARGTDAQYGTTLVYYPGSLDPDGAVEIVLQGGMELAGIDVTVRRERMYTVSGRVVGETGAAAMGAISVYRVSGGAMAPLPTGTYVVERNGTFDIRHLAAGTYQMILQSGPPEGKVVVAAIEVIDRDVTSLVLAYGSGVDIPVRVALESQTDPVARPELAGVRVALRPVENPLLFFASQKGADGLFTIAQAATGSHNVVVGGLPEGMFLKGVRFGEQDALSAGGVIAVTGRAETPLVVVVGARGAIVAGTVRTTQGRAVGGATVTVVPEDARARANFMKVDTADQSGVFGVAGLRPGAYRLLAWEDVDAMTVSDPDFLKQFEGRGVKITVSEGTSATAHLTTVPASDVERAARR